MQDYSCFFFDLYNTILDDSHGLPEREQYRLDSIYTILEKSLFPIKFSILQKAYGEILTELADIQENRHIAFSPFHQVDTLLRKLNVHDVVVFKKVYDSYVDAVLQISPKLVKNAEKALAYLKDKGKKIGLISNTGRTPGNILRLLMKELNIYQYFDDMVFSDEVGVMKPDMIIFDVALKRIGAQKKESIFIGDLKAHDYEGARNAGLSAHLFKKNEEDLYQIAVSYSGDYE